MNSVSRLQHEFRWQETNYDMHRNGAHPHISILDKLFVETIGGDLTIKIEDNTDEGKGILNEPVEHRDQTLDDAKILFADLRKLNRIKYRSIPGIATLLCLQPQSTTGRTYSEY